MTLEPWDLPAVPPSVSDWQHGKVEEAEAEVRGTRLPSEDDRAYLRKLGLSLQQVEGTGCEYWRERSLLEYGRFATLEQLLHHAAHHLTDPVFPAHGAEWAGHFLALVRSRCGNGRAAAYRTAFDRHEVHYKPEHRALRVHKATRFAPRKDPGCLARIICDDPPREILCQMLERDGDVLRIRDRAGEHELTLEEIRYVSYSVRR